MSKGTVLITGTNRGLGLEMVQQYAEQGWKVHACARNPEQAADLKQLADLHSTIQLLALDLSDDLQIEALATRLLGEPIDLLINNAGVYGPKGISTDQIDRQTWLEVLNINTISPFMVTRALLPNLQAGQLKKVALVSSKMGSMDDNTSGGSYIYRTGKAAVNSVGKSLSVDLAEQGISVVVLHPGWVQTDMGGPNALINSETSVSGMRKVIDDTNLQNSGRFVAFDGKEIGW